MKVKLRWTLCDAPRFHQPKRFPVPGTIPLDLDQFMAFHAYLPVFTPSMGSMPLMLFVRPLPLPNFQSLICLQRRVPRITPHLSIRNSATAFTNIKGKQVFPGKGKVVSKASKNKPQERPRVHLPACKFPSKPPPTPDPSEILHLPYHIHRTPSQQLPIYKLAKRGGSLRQTRLRKIEGDMARLRSDLRAALGLEDGEITINQLTKHIIIRVC